MAMYAQRHFAAGFCRQHLVHNILMTCKTRALRDAPVPWLDLNWLVKIFKRKRQRMIESVIRFNQQATQMVVRKMAIIANGDVAMC